MTQAPQHPAGYLALLAGARPVGAPLSPRERGAVSTVQGVPLGLVFPAAPSSPGLPWHPAARPLPRPSVLPPPIVVRILVSLRLGARAQIPALSSNHTLTSCPHPLTFPSHLESHGVTRRITVPPPTRCPPESVVLHPTPMLPVSPSPQPPRVPATWGPCGTWAQVLAHREASWALRAPSAQPDVLRGSGECGRLDSQCLGLALRPCLLWCLHSVGFLTKCFTLNNGLNSSLRVRHSTTVSRLFERLWP